MVGVHLKSAEVEFVGRHRWCEPACPRTHIIDASSHAVLHCTYDGLVLGVAGVPIDGGPRHRAGDRQVVGRDAELHLGDLLGRVEGRAAAEGGKRVTDEVEEEEDNPKQAGDVRGHDLFGLVVRRVSVCVERRTKEEYVSAH